MINILVIIEALPENCV